MKRAAWCSVSALARLWVTASIVPHISTLRPQSSSRFLLCVLQDRLLLSDVSVTHCCADTYVATAATTAGSAAEARAAKKVARYALREPDGYDFTPLVVESYGR